MKIILLLTFVFYLFYFSYANDLYCGERDCYDILGLSTFSNVKDITKRYRELSLKYHPDRNSAPEADKLFREVAAAYAVLSDPEKRLAYDHYITHPQDFAYNYGMYVVHVYQPKTDFRAVILFFIVVLSVLQYLGLQTRYNSKIKQIRNSDQLKIEASHILMERSSQNVKAKSPSNLKERKKRKEKQKEMLQDIIDELMEDIQADPKYRKPCIYDVLFFQILIFPFTFFKWMKWQIVWFYRHTILALPYNKEEKIYLTCLVLGIPEEVFLHGEYDDEEQEDLLERELWIPENLEKYDKEIEEEMKEKNPGKYKKMLRGKKNGAVDYADFEDDY